jgi:hypothetical protein
VVYLFKARTVEPEKQPMLENGFETIFVCRQRLGKHIPAATDTYGTIEVLLEIIFSTRSVQWGCTEDKWVNRVISLQEAVRKTAAGWEPPFRDDLSV